MVYIRFQLHLFVSLDCLVLIREVSVGKKTFLKAVMEHDREDDFADDDPDESSSLGLTKELLEEIRSTKKNNPGVSQFAFHCLALQVTLAGMFVSAWQEDEHGIVEANLNDPKEKFLKEAEKGNVDVLRSMLQETPDLLSSCDEDGYTALHRAAYNDHLEALLFLLEKGADSGARVHLIYVSGLFKIVVQFTLLCKQSRTKQGWTPLHSAANWGNYKIVGQLISHGVDVNARSHGSVTPLHLAISSQCENPENVFHTVRYLLEAPVRGCCYSSCAPYEMSCHYLVKVNSQLSKLGDFFVNYGGCLFLIFMLVTVYYVGLYYSCHETYPSDYCSTISNIGIIIVVEILTNLTLFQYYSSHNCVSHWQRQACVADLCRNAVFIGDLIEEEQLKCDSAYLSRFCNLCGCDAPIRSHHCPICKICVLRKDHHCFITGACVGLGNQRYFIPFLFWCFVGLLFGARFIVVYLYQTTFAEYLFAYLLSSEFLCNIIPVKCVCRNPLLGFFYCVGPIALIRWMFGFTDFFFAFVCMIFSFILVSIMASGGFFGMQIYYTCYGYTMYEYHSSVRHAFHGDGATVRERFRLVFGRYWLINFLFPLFWNRQLLTMQIATNLFLVRTSHLYLSDLFEMAAPFFKTFTEMLYMSWYKLTLLYSITLIFISVEMYYSLKKKTENNESKVASHPYNRYMRANPHDPVNLANMHARSFENAQQIGGDSSSSETLSSCGGNCRRSYIEGKKREKVEHLVAFTCCDLVFFFSQINSIIWNVLTIQEARIVSQVIARLEEAEHYYKGPDINELRDMVMPPECELLEEVNGRVLMFVPLHECSLHGYAQKKSFLMTEADVEPIFRQIVRILSFCHTLGIIVRNLKPRKLVFDQQNRIRLENVLDCIVCDNPADDRMVDKYCTPAFAAPEVVNRSPNFSGKACDVWSLGILLYLLLLGRYPFYDDTPAGVFSKIRVAKVVLPPDVHLSAGARALIFWTAASRS
ncbi:DHHC zinc finger domain protein [Dictyocaulus viviparus]|uniref:DHHC zinc finger domain protein n=1 Tax=Dictyocaulus viviparus TaxID=29172 RepID=A0A0D8XQK1_DICVI|nr:DHHC zinc finger domain protein [Dictyocaulus viviparus]